MSQQQTVSLSKLGTGPDDFADGIITPSSEYLQHLERLRNQMRGKASIRIELLSDNELASRIKCRNCGMRCESQAPSPCPVADDRAAFRQQAIQTAEEAASEGHKW